MGLEGKGGGYLSNGVSAASKHTAARERATHLRLAASEGDGRATKSGRSHVKGQISGLLLLSPGQQRVRCPEPDAEGREEAI